MADERDQFKESANDETERIGRRRDRWTSVATLVVIAFVLAVAVFAEIELVLELVG